MKKLCSVLLGMCLLGTVGLARADFAGDLAAGVPLDQAVDTALQNGETLDAIAAAAKAAGVSAGDLTEALIQANVDPLLVRNAMVAAGYPEDEVVAALGDLGYSSLGPTRRLDASTYSTSFGAGGGGAVGSPN